MKQTVEVRYSSLFASDIKKISELICPEQSCIERVIAPDDYSGDFKERIKQVTKSALLVCASVAPDKSDLFEFKLKKLEKLYLYPDKPSRNIQQHQALLVSWLKETEYWLTKDLKKELGETPAMEWLSRAEPYTIILQPKKTILTIHSLKSHVSKKLPGETNIYCVQKSTPLNPLSDALLEEFLCAHPNHEDCPAWYKALPAFEKKLFDITFSEFISDGTVEPTQENLVALKKKLQTIPSLLRSIPGLANFYKHELFYVKQTMDTQNELKPKKKFEIVKAYKPRYRSAMIAPRDICDYSHLTDQEKQALVDKITHDNVARVIQNYIDDHSGITLENLSQKAVLLQTLVTNALDLDKPLLTLARSEIDKFRREAKKLEIDANCLSFKIDDLQKQWNMLSHKLFLLECKMDDDFYFNKQSILLSGTPLLLESKWQDDVQSRTALEEKQDLLRAEITALQSEADQYKTEAKRLRDLVNELQVLSKELKTVINTVPDPGASLRNQRELYMAALEEMIAMRLDLVCYGSCVSVNDTKAVELMYTDTLELFWKVYGFLPAFHLNIQGRKINTVRNNFISLFESIFGTGHHEELASIMNAPGARGIKTPHHYLPWEIVERLKDRFQISDQLASNNKFLEIMQEHVDWSLHKARFDGVARGFTASGSFGLLTVATIAICVIFFSVPPAVIALGCVIAIGCMIIGSIYGGFSGDNQYRQNQIAGLERQWHIANGTYEQLQFKLRNTYDEEHSFYTDMENSEKDPTSDAEDSGSCCETGEEYQIIGDDKSLRFGIWSDVENDGQTLSRDLTSGNVLQ